MTNTTRVTARLALVDDPSGARWSDEAVAGLVGQQPKGAAGPVGRAWIEDGWVMVEVDMLAPDMVQVTALGIERYHALIDGPTPLGSKASIQAYGDLLDRMVRALPDAQGETYVDPVPAGEVRPDERDLAHTRARDTPA